LARGGCAGGDDIPVAGERVLGVDACKPGWIGIALNGETTTAYTATHIDELVAAAHAGGPIEVVAIDMPIGLPDARPRRADLLARAAVGPRRSSVFTTPVRAALEAAHHATAVAINRKITGAGVSAQAFALRHKLLEVDAWVRCTDTRVVEVHPEVSFATLAGTPLTERKITWTGAVHRRRLLAEAGIRLDDDLGASSVLDRRDPLASAGGTTPTAPVMAARLECRWDAGWADTSSTNSAASRGERLISACTSSPARSGGGRRLRLRHWPWAAALAAAFTRCAALPQPAR